MSSQLVVVGAGGEALQGEERKWNGGGIGWRSGR